MGVTCVVFSNVQGNQKREKHHNLKTKQVHNTYAYLSPQFKYMIFHIFICILHILRVYYKLTK